MGKGSMKEELQKVTFIIYQHCLDNGIQLEMECIPMSFNEKADLNSQLKDTNDWDVFILV